MLFRSNDECTRMPGGAGGLSGGHGRPVHGSRCRGEAAHAVWPLPRGAGGRSRDVDEDADRCAAPASRAGLPLGASVLGDPQAGGGGSAAAVALRREEPGGDRLASVPGGAIDRLFQSAAGQGAGPEAGGAVGGHGNGSSPDRKRRGPPDEDARKRPGDRSSRGAPGAPAQGGQALRSGDRGGIVLLRPERGVDPAGGGLGRDLRDPHERAGGAALCGRRGAGV